MLKAFLPAAAVLQVVSCLSWGTEYFVADSGNDQNDGFSPSTAWKSVARVNAHRFQPGDKILFQGGDRFEGSVVLSKEDSGTRDAPVELGTYGEGRAAITAGKGSGVSTVDVENLVIRNLIISGDGPLKNTGYGVYVENTNPDRMLAGLLIDSLEISGFGEHGMMVTGKTHGYENVTIVRCSLHQNRKGGLEVAGKLPWDATIYAHRNVTVSECRAFDNPGDSTYTKNHSGSGLVLYQVDGGRIEKSAAWSNGELCPAAGGGPVGIWTCASRRITIEYCESFGNRTQGLDGGGFDIDGGSEECVLQYNYSHDNDGPGLMAYTYPYASHADRGNIVRFNISVNDAVKSDRYGGLYVRADGRKMEALQVYNNTVMTRGRYAALIHADGVQAALRNNIFASGENGLPLRIDGDGDEFGLELKRNLYWRGGAPFLVRWGNRELASLAEMETAAKGTELSLYADPEIEVQPAGIPNPVRNLRILTQFRPRHEGVRNGGFAIASSGAGISGDFLGNDLRISGVPIGAIGGW